MLPLHPLMKLIKKLDIFILKQYLQLFAGTFFICLFIFLMQFVWLYMTDLVGKGLGIKVLARFMFYASMSLVPLALPLSLLLTSLITFGNLGEKLELLAMKAAGISLLRIVRPVLIFVIMMSAGSFYFQNIVKPYATRELSRLLYSMRQKSPELEIPEGVFYNEIPGYNLFVEHKDLKTGMLYGIMIYTQGTDFDDTQIVLADSGRLQSTADQGHLQLTLYDGERFRNMQNTGGAMDRSAIPYLRETFKEEVDLIPFESGLNLMDASAFGGDARAKNLTQLTRGVDSLTHEIDSMGRAQYASFEYMFFTRVDTALQARVEAKEEKVPFDTLYAGMNDVQRAQAYRLASDKVRTGATQTDMLKEYSEQQNRGLRMHKLEQQAKFSLTLACLIFFFIGAPLGAIIRKGGLGVPVVVSVVIFIFYYMINASGEKMAKGGSLDPFFGQWLSSIVLIPIASWLTWKANQDSAVFNFEAYQMFFSRLFGLPLKRHINRKEVIMYDPDYERISTELPLFCDDCNNYIKDNKLQLFPNYFRIFFRYKEDTEVMVLNDRLEAFVDELANTRDNRIIGALNTLPILIPDAHTRPFHNARLNMILGIIFPIGIYFWLRIWRFRLRLWRDMVAIQKQGAYIVERCQLQTSTITSNP